jgi:hypothetical protein
MGLLLSGGLGVVGGTIPQGSVGSAAIAEAVLVVWAIKGAANPKSINRERDLTCRDITVFADDEI